MITELKRAEADRTRLAAQLHEAQRLEGLGRLAGGVAHDFNNLLTIVQMNVDLVLSAREAQDLVSRDGSAAGVAPSIRERIVEIGDAARRAASLTRQLLAFGRKQELAPRTIDLRSLVQGIAPLLRRLVAEHTSLEIVTASGVGPVYADPVELERVLVNLVMNAEDAMPDGGAITITTRALAIDAPREGLTAGPHVVLEVHDTGTGMEPETLAHAFEPFYTTKGFGRGTGLGLATVHGIVRQSGGAVEIETRPGQGTNVRVILPEVLGDVERTAESAIPASSQAHRWTLLLVEDEPGVRNVTKLLLEANGFDVIAPTSSLSASKISGDALARIDLLITDVVMPELSGTSLAGRLRERSPHLPVLLISGHMTESAADEADGYRFIAKPFDEKALLRAVREALAIQPAEEATA